MSTLLRLCCLLFGFVDIVCVVLLILAVMFVRCVVSFYCLFCDVDLVLFLFVLCSLFCVFV